MSVIIGSARIDERNKISGGSNKNNAPHELSTQEWYLHHKGWYVLRAKEKSVAEKIAQNMQFACDSKYIGYDQSENNTLYKVVKPLNYDISKLNTYCETDCARLVRVCILYAGISVEDFYTGNLKEYVLRTGKFDLFTSDDYCKSSRKLRRGDILVTRTKGHVVVVLSNGADFNSKWTPEEKEEGKTVDITLKELSKGMTGREVMTLQVLLEGYGYPVGEYGTDGDFGTDTRYAVKCYQKDHGLKVDGIVGEKTWRMLLTGN